MNLIELRRCRQLIAALGALRLNHAYPPAGALAEHLQGVMTLPPDARLRRCPTTGWPHPEEWLRVRADRELAPSLLPRLDVLAAAGDRRSAERAAALRALTGIRALKDEPPELALVDDAPEGLTAQLSLTLYDLSAPRFVRLIVRLIDPARRHLRLDGPSVRASEPLRVRLASAAERGAVGAARLLTADGVRVVELSLGGIGPITDGDHGVKLSASLSRLSAELPQHHIDDPLSPELPVPDASAGLRLSHQRKWAVPAEDLIEHRAELARRRSKNLSYGYTVPE